jgi:hypothetical protein
MEFVEAVHAQLTNRDKLTAVLTHLENTTSDDEARVRRDGDLDPAAPEADRRPSQSHFLDISARSSKVDFAKPDPEKETESGSGYFGYSPPINLQLWSIDIEKELVTSCPPLERFRDKFGQAS